MREEDYKAVKIALDTSIESAAMNLALYNALQKVGIVIDENFYKAEKERIISGIRNDVYEKINK